MLVVSSFNAGVNITSGSSCVHGKGQQRGILGERGREPHTIKLDGAKRLAVYASKHQSSLYTRVQSMTCLLRTPSANDSAMITHE